MVKEIGPTIEEIENDIQVLAVAQKRATEFKERKRLAAIKCKLNKKLRAMKQNE